MATKRTSDTGHEKPEIELYMYSLNQEFPVGKGHATFLKRHSETLPDAANRLVRIEQVAGHTYGFDRFEPGDWAAEWVHNQWVENWTQTGGGERVEDPDPLARLILREEAFGGLAFDPRSDRVYRLNRSGFAVLREIIGSEKGPRRATIMSELAESPDTRPFLEFLRGAGLWLP